MTSLTFLFSDDNPVFSAFAFYASILVLKMLVMAPLTARQRFKKMVFANPEDAKSRHKATVKFDDPDVERVRRGHQNDLENILPFLFIGLLYVLTSPSEYIAVMLFRIFTICRILHTIVYTVVVIPQPARFLAFIVPMFITIYMALQVAYAFA